MKKLLALITIVLLTASLSACATGSNGAKVKCPACGYEFNVGAGSAGSE